MGQATTRICCVLFVGFLYMFQNKMDTGRWRLVGLLANTVFLGFFFTLDKTPKTEGFKATKDEPSV